MFFSIKTESEITPFQMFLFWSFLFYKSLVFLLPIWHEIEMLLVSSNGCFGFQNMKHVKCILLALIKDCTVRLWFCTFGSKNVSESTKPCKRHWATCTEWDRQNALSMRLLCDPESGCREETKRNFSLYVWSSEHPW